MARSVRWEPQCEQSQHSCTAQRRGGRGAQLPHGAVPPALLGNADPPVCHSAACQQQVGATAWAAVQSCQAPSPALRGTWHCHPNLQSVQCGESKRKSGAIELQGCSAEQSPQLGVLHRPRPGCSISPPSAAAGQRNSLRRPRGAPRMQLGVAAVVIFRE